MTEQNAKRLSILKIAQKKWTGPSHYIVSLSGKFPKTLPGQFVMLSVAGLQDPFLKRPFSVYRQRTEGGKSILDLLIKVVGKGTAQLARFPNGTSVEVIGPLGKEFEVSETKKNALLIGGGIGVAPLVMLANDHTMIGKTITALIGGKTANDLQGVQELRECGIQIKLSTEDGGAGHKGLITDLVSGQLSSMDANQKEQTVIYCCGPDGMMKAVGKIAAEHGVDCQLSLEARMGCGFGVCLGCVVKNTEDKYQRVCVEGPVVNSQKLSDYK